jgi:hypothetical protein
MRFAALLVLVGLAGCDDNRFFRGARNLVNKPVEVPDAREPSLAAAARVDQVGRQILSANLFCGVDTSFQVVGHRDSLLFHRGQESLFISDSLVDRCKTDEELAAVLCHELGRMIAEKRTAARMGYAEPLMDVTHSNNGEIGGITGDQFRLAELAAIERRTPKKVVDRVRSETTDPRKIARELLQTTGFDVSHSDRVEPMLQGLNKNRGIVNQLDGAAAKPEWSN